MARSSYENGKDGLCGREVDTVIVGNGPSALILSYILHGWIPYYIGGHSDAILDSKLKQRPCLLDLTPDLYAHFLSSLRYSTQALPVNTLLDTLLRPNADTEINPASCIEWRFEADKAIEHVAIGQAGQAGGQWAENPVQASWDIGTLSYAEQLSLPGYSYEEHLRKGGGGKTGEADFVRPSRTEVAGYLKAYPSAVGIEESVYTGLKVGDVKRVEDGGGGFEIGSLGMRCKNLVLASGIFSVNIPPPPLLAPIAHLENDEAPLLVIGSGFTAADIIISAPPTRKIMHIYQWAPETRPSPLRGCHHTAYPEYATVYRQMKLSTLNNTSKNVSSAKSPLQRRKSNPFFSQRDWNSVYEGLPNAQILSVEPIEGDSNTATLTILTSQNTTITRTIGHLEYVVGRRGTLDYLSASLRAEVMSTSPSPHSTPSSTPSLISGRTLRQKSESSLEVAKKVFIIGSLAGDSLIRHAVGGCVFAAGRILGHIPPSSSSSSSSTSTSTSSPSPASSGNSSPRISPQSSSLSPTTTTTTNTTTTTMNGDASEDTNTSASRTPISASETTNTRFQSNIHTNATNEVKKEEEYTTPIANGHSDLHLDRRKLAREVEVANAENACWVDSGWWAGGVGGYRKV